MRGLRKGDIRYMIECHHGHGVIRGDLAECLADFGILVKHFIISVPEEYRLTVIKEIEKQLKNEIDLAMKGGEENEKS